MTTAAWAILLVLASSAVPPESVAAAEKRGSLLDALFNREQGTPVERQFLMERVVYRKEEPVHVLSNLPQDDVMRAICGDALLRKGKCVYMPLGEVGTFDRREHRLLGYNWRKKNETVVVVDRASLTADEARGLAALQAEVFPALSAETQAPHAMRLWVQNSGMREFQVYLEVPSAAWSRALLEKLWELADGADGVTPGSKKSLTREYRVWRIAALSNDEAAAQSLIGCYEFSEPRTFPLASVDEFLAVSDVDMKVVLLNWNADEEVTREMLATLPAPWPEKAADDPPDRMGLTAWQRFCRSANVEALAVDDAVCAGWILAAPTSRHLEGLAERIARVSRGDGKPSVAPLVDLSAFERVAVGVHFISPDVDRERLVLQEQLEQAVNDQLRLEIARVVSTQDWGALLHEVLGGSATSPFRDARGAARIVSATNADLLLLLRVRSIQPLTVHRWERHRLTPPLGPPPEVGDRPDPDAKILFGGHRYPGKSTWERQGSRQYQRDLARWHESVKQKEDHELAGRMREVEYELESYVAPEITLAGFLQVVDLDAHELLWSRELSMTSEGERRSLGAKRVKARGEDGVPDEPPLPPARSVWEEGTYKAGQICLQEALRDGLQSLQEHAVWADDIKPWNEPTALIAADVRGTEEPAQSAEAARPQEDDAETRLAPPAQEQQPQEATTTGPARAETETGSAEDPGASKAERPWQLAVSDAQRWPKVVVNASGGSWCDHLAVGQLLAAVQRIAEIGPDGRPTNTRPQIAGILQIRYVGPQFIEAEAHGSYLEHRRGDIRDGDLVAPVFVGTGKGRTEMQAQDDARRQIRVQMERVGVGREAGTALLREAISMKITREPNAVYVRLAVLAPQWPK